MSPSESQTQRGKRSRETSEVFDSVFGFLMDFADKAETTVPQPKRRAFVDDDTTNEVHHEEEEEEPSEDGGDGNAGELFDKLPVREKEKLLKDAFGEIMGNMLDKLPEDGKEPFLSRCFDGLFPKLPRQSRRVIGLKVKDVSSQFQEDSPTLGAPESSSPIPWQFPPGSDDLILCRRKLRRPHTVGNPQPPPGTGAQQPPPGQQQPPSGTGAQQPPPGQQQPPPGNGAQQPPPGPTA